MNAKALASVLLLGAAGLRAASLSPGDLAVLQVGTGSGSLSSAATALVIDEFSASSPNDLIQAINVPTDGTGLTLSGTATSEGQLTLSTDGSVLTFGGYVAAAGTASIASSTVPRAVGVLGGNGQFSFTASTAGTLAFSGNNIRGAVSDGQNYWLTGTAGSTANGGVWYSAGGAAPSQVVGGNLRSANILNGNLSYSTGAGTRGIYQFSGLPTTTAAATILPGLGTSVNPSPYDFAISPDGATMYVADDTTTGAVGTQGLQKWVLTGGLWVEQYVLSVGGTGGTNAARQLTVAWGATPTIFATTTESAANRLVEIIDNGSASASTVQTLETASANTIFRGVDYAPGVVPEPSVGALLGCGIVGLLWFRRRTASARP